MADNKRQADEPSAPNALKRAKTLENFSLDKIIVDFEDGVDAILSKLTEFGCVRVDGVFTPNECANGREGIVAHMEGLGAGYHRNDDWNASRDVLPPQTRRGMFQALVSCIPALCEMQGSKRYRSIFEAAYGTDKLIVSADGINWAPPVEQRSTKRWDHLDQSTPGVYKDIQGVINLNTTDAGTVVWPKSHLVFERLLEELEIADKSNWVFLANYPKRMAIARRLMDETPGSAEAVVVPSVEGSVTLWLSSTIHAACEPTTDWRVAHYVSYRPVVQGTGIFGFPITKRGIKTRANAFRNKRHTNHWADRTVAKRPGFWRIYSVKPYHPIIMDYLADPTTVPGTLQEASGDLAYLYGLEPWSE